MAPDDLSEPQRPRPPRQARRLKREPMDPERAARFIETDDAFTVGPPDPIAPLPELDMPLEDKLRLLGLD